MIKNAPKGKTKVAKPTKEETNDAIFAEGIRVFSPHKSAPSFMKGTVIISPTELAKWCKNNDDLLHNSDEYGVQLKLNLKESKNGKLYFSVDTYGLDS